MSTDVVSVCVCEPTKNKSIYNDSRHWQSNQEAKGSIDVKVRSESGSNPAHSLESQTDKDDDPATVPGK